MFSQKIAFISCVNNIEQYNEAKEYIYNLQAPDGFEIEFIKIMNSENIFKGYNKGMKSTDAKYKVYLHQDVFILNEKFILDILKIFHNNKTIGLLGVIGSRKMPQTGIWWDSEDKFGEVYDSHAGQMSLVKFQQPNEEFEIVQAVDGLIMATQYDCNWREDIFNGWHFYDISQCLEFIKNGYFVAVPKQQRTWCLHDCGIANTEGYEKNRKIFLSEYCNIML